MREGLWLPVFGGRKYPSNHPWINQAPECLGCRLTDCGVSTVCFVLGIVTIGSRTIATVGSKITKLTQSSAFAVQAGATMAVLLSTAIGLPVSTSHCLVGALIGTGIAGKYAVPPELGAPNRNAPLDLNVLKKIVLAWVVTIPLSVVLALSVYVPLRGALSTAVSAGSPANASSMTPPL